MDVSRGSGAPADQQDAPAAGPDAIDCGALRYTDDLGEKHYVVLGEDRRRLLIGRDESCDVVIGWDMLVSREHAILELNGSHWYLVDDGMSRHGTHVNRKRVVGRHRLEPDDRLLVGRTLLTFRAPTRTAVGSRTQTRTGSEPLVRLTEAQERVLRALCAPLLGDPDALPATNRQIAAELHICEDAVKDHLQQLFRKFELHELKQNEKRIRLARRAVNTGQV